MGWELTDLQIDRGGQLATAFHFEVQFSSETTSSAGVLRGDGIVLRNGRVRLNREDAFRARVQALGHDPAVILGLVAARAARQSRSTAARA